MGKKSKSFPQFFWLVCDFYRKKKLEKKRNNRRPNRVQSERRSRDGCSMAGERKAMTLFGETTARTIHDHVHYLLPNFPQTDRPPFHHYIIIIGRLMIHNHFLCVRDTVRRTYLDPVLFLFFCRQRFSIFVCTP